MSRFTSLILVVSTAGALVGGCRPSSPSATANDSAPGAAPARLVYVFETGCPDCEIVRGELLPRILELRGATWDDVVAIDVASHDGLERCLEIEREAGASCPVLAPALFLDSTVFCGVDAIRAFLDSALDATESPDSTADAPTRL